MSTPKFIPTADEKKKSQNITHGRMQTLTIVLGAEDDRADRTRDIVEGKRVSVTIDMWEDLQWEYQDGDVRDDPEEEEERGEARGEQGDHRLQR
jgi:hypothetical protein